MLGGPVDAECVAVCADCPGHDGAVTGFFGCVAARMAGDAADGTQRHYWLADQRIGHDVRGDSRVYALERLEQLSDCACDY